MGPVRQNPIQRTVSLFICMCIALCTIVAHNIAQNRPDSFPPYPPDNHHYSDDVYLREGGTSQPDAHCSSQYPNDSLFTSDGNDTSSTKSTEPQTTEISTYIFCALTAMTACRVPCVLISTKPNGDSTLDSCKHSADKTRLLYCVECPQYSIRLEELSYLCDCLSGLDLSTGVWHRRKFGAGFLYRVHRPGKRLWIDSNGKNGN